MLAFSLNEDVTSYLSKVVTCLNNNEGYIRKFNPKNPEEAKSNILDTAIRNRKEEYDNVTPYIKKTARHITPISYEIPIDTLNEDGEVNVAFQGLISNEMERVEVNIDKKIFSCLDEMYLIDPEYVKRLKKIFFSDEITDKNLRQYKPTGERMRQLWSELQENTRYTDFLPCIIKFYQMLEEKESKIRQNEKDIKIKDVSYDNLNLLPTESIIKSKTGEMIDIDRKTLYSKIDLDMTNWELVVKQIGVQKIDISEYIDMLYKWIYVEEGVDTKIITWAINGGYKLRMPSGVIKINEDKQKFVELCYRELFLNILVANIGVIIGATPDSIYIKQKGRGLKCIRCQTVYNKTVILPVENV